jgi:hypothetical protein
VNVADGEPYGLVEDYPDWNEGDNARFPLDYLIQERGQTADEQRQQFRESPERRRRRMKERGVKINTPLDWIDKLPAIDEPEVIVTLSRER